MTQVVVQLVQVVEPRDGVAGLSAEAHARAHERAAVEGRALLVREAEAQRLERVVRLLQPSCRQGKLFHSEKRNNFDCL